MDTTESPIETTPVAADEALPAEAVEDPSTEAPEGTEDAENEGDEPKAETRPPSKLMAALARKRAKFQRERAEFEQSRAEFQRQSETLQAQVREAAELKALIAKLKEDPDSVADALGLDYNQWTLRRLRAGTPEAKIEALEARIAAEETQRQERQKAADVARAAEGQRAAEQAFLGLVKGSGDLFPETSLYDDNEVIEAADAIAGEMTRERGAGRFSFHDVATELEARLAALHERQRARLGAPSKSPSRPTSGQGSRTLTSRASAESAGARRELTDRERFDLAVRALEREMSRRLGSSPA